MTAIVLSQIPSGINTYERLAVWAMQCLQDIANGQEVNVQQNSDGQAIAACQTVITADGVPRFMLTAYLPVDMPALNSGTEKTWMATKDISAATPHVNLLSN